MTNIMEGINSSERSCVATLPAGEQMSDPCHMLSNVCRCLISQKKRGSLVRIRKERRTSITLLWLGFCCNLCT